MKGLPLVSSKLLDKRWKSRDQEIHKQRLRQVKSQMRVMQSTPFVPLVRNTKKEELAERTLPISITLKGRFTEIEKANRILLERMTSIMQSTNRNLSNPQSNFKTFDDYYQTSSSSVR